MKNKSDSILFNSEKPTSGDGLPTGWFNGDDIKTYKNLYKKLSENSITAEIGVWQGRSLCSVADIIIKKNITVYAVDTFLGSPSALDVVNDCNGELKKIFIKNLAKFKLENSVIIIETDSVQAAKKINSKLDLVFIDGDHNALCVKNDISAWMPHVKPEGILAGHDYQWVKNTVHILFKKMALKVFSDNNIYWTIK